MEQDTFDYSGTAFISHTRSNFQCIAPQNRTIFLLPIEPSQQKQVFSPLEDTAINPGGKQQQKIQSTEERYLTGHKRVMQITLGKFMQITHEENLSLGLDISHFS